MKCIDIEIAVMRHFDFRQNLIVPNLTPMSYLVSFETDMIVLTKSGYAYGFEIKVSANDLKADFKKGHYVRFNERRGAINPVKGFARWFPKIKHFYYAIPYDLLDLTLELVPSHFGVVSIDKHGYLYVKRKPKMLSNYKWTDKERYELARLGAMRIFSLKLKNKNK